MSLLLGGPGYSRAILNGPELLELYCGRELGGDGGGGDLLKKYTSETKVHNSVNRGSICISNYA